MKQHTVPSPIHAVLFDLDGTLADTAQDLAFALNTLLQEQQRTPILFQEIRPHVSNGANALIKLGFGQQISIAELDTLRARFLNIYRNNLTTHTQLFPGIWEAITFLDENQIKWGIVTNKPQEFTEPLMMELELPSRAAVIVSGDTLKYKKPHPAPIVYACKKLDSHPSATVYIGDAHRDIEAGRRAGTKTLAALFGYLAADDDPTLWKADATINHASEIIPWLSNLKTYK
ncbi:Similar to phosphoglycolate phosphatase, clustered with ubiquinone biosynthesis SAM-dependent O-methyltransferase [hydrothermal vent metagenome]|uniref:Similar to phosphoglycolate phosphatase, clustered with ubiquinone biosynthesis SAM-dependent O-methyltransferase n=1 Tax=hydrothermal vent metagenome TaxID=652676 RepID=A0A3B1A7L9_9ZZZZ